MFSQTAKNKSMDKELIVLTDKDTKKFEIVASGKWTFGWQNAVIIFWRLLKIGRFNIDMLKGWLGEK